jgi:hypothetical protein
MMPLAAQLRTYLDQGGTVVATGERHSEFWLPGFSFHPQPPNYWWWLEKNGDLGVKVIQPDHPLFQHVAPDALTWHFYGWFDPASSTTISRLKAACWEDYDRGQMRDLSTRCLLANRPLSFQRFQRL